MNRAVGFQRQVQTALDPPVRFGGGGVTSSPYPGPKKSTLLSAMFPRFLLSLGIVMSLPGQDPPDPLHDPLHQVRLKVSDTLDHLPRYMCTQTISRTRSEEHTSE